jgi:chromosome segregation ATPase
MSLEEPLQKPAHLRVTNIGGITDTAVELPPGVTVLEGRNATNRTSLLQAIMAACGSDHATLKGDTNEGTVELTIGDDTYTRQLTRTNDTDTVTFNGEPYLNDPIGADFFAFLLETNETRQAVERGEELRDIIMRPVDTDAIQAEIDRLEQEKRDLEQQLDDLDDLEQQLPQLEDQRTQLEADIEAKRDDLAAKEAELEAADTTVEETREEKADLDAKLDELRETRASLDDIRYDIDTQQESLEHLRDTQDELQAEYEDLPEPTTNDQEEITAELERLRDRKSRLEADLNDLQRLIQFNEEMFNEADGRDLAALNPDDDTATTNEAVTDQLLADSEQFTCWTCGSTVDHDQIEDTVNRLSEFRQQKLSRIAALEDEIEDLETTQQERRTTRQRRDEIEQRLNEIDTEIDEREGTLADLQTKREELTDEIETLEDEVEELEDEAYSEILNLHKEANQLEFELDRLETEIDNVTAEIAEIEDQLAQRDDLDQQRDAIQEDLTEQRTRIEQLETQAVEEFNRHIETVLDLLEYKNIERIWLERKETQVQEGRRKVEKTVFDLHVIRSTAAGTTYEDTVDHLSESEREVTGLVLALAGYLTHDLYETVPFMLLDSVEALDAERIAALVDHLREYAPYLVVALLPEDAAALDDNYTYITDL